MNSIIIYNNQILLNEKRLRLFCFIILSFNNTENLYSQFNPDSLQTRINKIVKQYVDTNKAGMVVGIMRKEGSAPILSRRYSFGT